MLLRPRLLLGNRSGLLLWCWTVLLFRRRAVLLLRLWTWRGLLFRSNLLLWSRPHLLFGCWPILLLWLRPRLLLRLRAVLLIGLGWTHVRAYVWLFRTDLGAYLLRWSWTNLRLLRLAWLYWLCRTDVALTRLSGTDFRA